jgi:hypothetical protein
MPKREGKRPEGLDEQIPSRRKIGNKTATIRELTSKALASGAKGCGFDPRRAHRL